METSQNCNENTTKKGEARERERFLRKAFTLRKKTNRAFGKRASGYKNAFLLRALAAGFEKFAGLNLFYSNLPFDTKKQDFLKSEVARTAKKA